MFKGLFGQKVPDRDAHALYGTVVARARDERLFEDYSIPDTVDGRFEMLVMHLFLLHARLKDEDHKARDISQRVFDNFIDDMDAALREAGVGDQVVPKRIAKMVRVFYGHTAAYETALDCDRRREELAVVIARNLYPENNGLDDTNGDRGTVLAEYMLRQAQHLTDSPTEDILKNICLFAPVKSDVDVSILPPESDL